MGNFKDDILEAADPESIEAIVIGGMGWADYNEEILPAASRDRSKWNRVLSWQEAAPLLDYEYSAGYGAPECQAITAWTPTRVLFVVQYDGSTRINEVLRNPQDHVPEMPGG